MNKVYLLGRLGAKPELRDAGGGKVVNVGLATSEIYYDKNKNKVEKTTWHDLVLWNRNAENFAKWIDKGNRVSIEGSIQKNKYKDKNGVEREGVKINVSRFEFIDTINQSETKQPDNSQEANSVHDSNNNQSQNLDENKQDAPVIDNKTPDSAPINDEMSDFPPIDEDKIPVDPDEDYAVVDSDGKIIF